MNDANPLSRNKELVDIFNLIGSYYIAERETYKAKAFIDASVSISQYPTLIESGLEAMSLKGVGKSSGDIIDEYLATGSVQRLKDLENKHMDRKKTVDYFTSFFGIGPVSANRFYDQGLRTLDDLWFKVPLTDAQKVGILWRDHINLRVNRLEIDLIKNKITELLQGIKFDISGSYRRQEATSGDIDVLIEAKHGVNMNDIVNAMSSILPATLALGEKLFMGIVRLSNQYNGHRIDIKIVQSQQYASALMHYTGSARFNVLMRQRAISMGMKLNEYGLSHGSGLLMPGINSEEDIFNTLKVKYIPPIERTKDIVSLTFI